MLTKCDVLRRILALAETCQASRTMPHAVLLRHMRVQLMSGTSYPPQRTTLPTTTYVSWASWQLQHHSRSAHHQHASLIVVTPAERQDAWQSLSLPLSPFQVSAVLSVRQDLKQRSFWASILGAALQRVAEAAHSLCPWLAQQLGTTASPPPGLRPSSLSINKVFILPQRVRQHHSLSTSSHFVDVVVHG